jgi:predicted RNA-binding protein associated with RNAse of E/G family
MTRATLYTQDNASEHNQCGVAVEVVWNRDEMLTAMSRGEITADQVASTLARGVKAVSAILVEFAARDKKLTDESIS